MVSCSVTELRLEKWGCDHLCYLAGFGDLNENVPHWLMHLRTWSPLDGTVRGDIGAFRKWHLGGGSRSLGVIFESYSSAPLSVHSLCFLHVGKDVTSQLPAPAAMPSLPL